MNTNEFYKELFAKYALDEDKIRRNAIKEAKTPAWKRTLDTHWKSAAGIAAAVAVTVGAVAYTAANPPGNINVSTTESMLSASQRLHDAENNYYNLAADEDERTIIYVSFRNKVCFKEMTVSLSAVADTEDIDIEGLYLEDGTVIRGAAEISEFAESNGSVKNITAAKLNAPLKCYKDINDLSAVRLAELGSADLNDDTFTPFVIDDSDPLMDDLKFISTTAESPSATTTPFSFAEETSPTSESSANASQASDTSADDTTSPAETDETDDDVLVEPDDTEDDTTIPLETEDEDENDPDDYTVVDEPDVTTSETSFSESSSEVSVPVTEIADAPDIGLMTQIYQLNVENSTETFLINNYAIVFTHEEAYIYRLGGMNVGPTEICKLASPKIGYFDDNTVIITGCGADGLRNCIVALDMSTDSIITSDASLNIGDAEIAAISYSATENKYFLKAISAATTYLYEMTPGETGIQYRPLFEYDGVVSVAGYRNSKLIFLASPDSVNYTLYSFDCTSGIFSKEATFTGTCKVRRSSTFESFVISNEDPETGETGAYVYDVNTSTLITIGVAGDIRIACKYGVTYIGIDHRDYILESDGSLTETSIRVEYGGKPHSDLVIVSTDSEKVVVAQKTESKWN